MDERLIKGQTFTSWDRMNRKFGIDVRYAQNDDQPSPPHGRVNSSRLCNLWSGDIVESSVYQSILSLIENPHNREINWVFDTNVIRRPADEAFWPRVFTSKRKVYLPIPVYHELTAWFDSNSEASQSVLKKTVRDSFHSENVFKKLDLDGLEINALLGIQYYVNLLGQRKWLDEIVARSEGISHSAKIASFVETTIGKRAKLLSSESRKENKRRNLFNDEIIIWYSIAQALVTRCETAIITFDRGLFEQFWKSVWMLDTHYRAMLFASLYAADPFVFRFCGIEENQSNKLFVGRFKKYEKPSSELNEILPGFYTPVTISCFYCDAHKSIQEQCSFTMDTNMIEVLKVKGRTGGLSSDKLDGKNCHIWLGPGMQDFGDYAAIVTDVSIPVDHVEFGRLCELSLLDMNLVLNVCEGGVRFNNTRLYVP